MVNRERRNRNGERREGCERQVTGEEGEREEKKYIATMIIFIRGTSASKLFSI